jgi:hypothetical protein
VLDEVREHVEHLGLDPDLLATPSKDDAIQVQLAVGESDHITGRSLRRWSGLSVDARAWSSAFVAEVSV